MLRRTLLGGLATASLLSLAARGASSPDPRTTADGQVRMRATVDGSPAFWSYGGTVYAVRPASRPLAILSVSGCQTEWAARLDDGSFRVAGMLLSFFRDPATGEFLDSWQNPFTKRRNLVAANRFDGGSAIYPADGSSMRVAGPLGASESAPSGFDETGIGRPTGLVAWQLTADQVLLRIDHAFDVRVQPQIEAQTLVAARSAFFDRDVARLPATYAASTIIPWMRWMDMAGVPGHLMWHTSGTKGFSVDTLPTDYRERAGAAIDDLARRPTTL